MQTVVTHMAQVVHTPLFLCLAGHSLPTHKTSMHTYTTLHTTALGSVYMWQGRRGCLNKQDMTFYHRSPDLSGDRPSGLRLEFTHTWMQLEIMLGDPNSIYVI